MPSHNYFPDSEANWPGWYGNFSRKFASIYAAQLGMTAEVVGLNNDSAMVEYLIDSYKNDFSTGRTTVTDFANQLMSGDIPTPTEILPYPVAPPYEGPMVAADINGRTRKLVARIKSAPDYTAEMGRDMGLVATDTAQEMSAPDLDITVMSGQMIKVKWLKGEADAIEVFLDFGTGFGKRGARYTRTPFEMEVELPDGQSAPIEATVRGRYVAGDKPIGDFGPEYPVTVRP